MNRSKAVFMFFLAGMAFGSAYGNSVIFSEDFENYETGSSIRRKNGFAIVDETEKQKQAVVGVGSFFKGGEKSLFYSDRDVSSGLKNLLLVNESVRLHGSVKVTFDYKVMAKVQNPTVTFLSGSTPAFGVNFFNVTGKVRHRTADKLEDVSPYVLSTNLWYRAEITMNIAENTYDLCVLEEDGGVGKEVINVKGVPFRNKVDRINKFMFGTMADPGTGGVDFYLDNIQVVSFSGTAD